MKRTFFFHCGLASPAHPLQQGPVALDPAVAHDFPLEVVRMAAAVLGRVARRLFHFVPRQLAVLIVGDQQHQGRIGIPGLDAFHEGVVGPTASHLAPRPDRPERTDPALHFPVQADHIGVLVRRQIQEGLVVGQFTFPLGCQEGERQPQTGQFLDDRLVGLDLAVNILLPAQVVGFEVRVDGPV